MELFHDTPLDGMADDLHVLIRRSSRRGVHVPDSDPATAMRAAHDVDENTMEDSINNTTISSSNNSNSSRRNSNVNI